MSRARSACLKPDTLIGVGTMMRPRDIEADQDPPKSPDLCEAWKRPLDRLVALFVHACTRERLDLRTAAHRLGLPDRARHRVASDLRRHARRRQRALRLRARGLELMGLHGRAGASHARAHRFRLHAPIGAHPRAARHGRARGVHLLSRVRDLLRLEGARAVDRIRTRIRSRRSAHRSRSRRPSGLRASWSFCLSPRSICCARCSPSPRAICGACANCSARARSKRKWSSRGKASGSQREATDDARRHPRPAGHPGAGDSGRGRPRLARPGAQPALLADLADRDHRRGHLVDHDLVHSRRGAVLRADGRDHAAHRHGGAHVCGDRPVGLVAARRADAFECGRLRGVGRAVGIERRDRRHGRHRRDGRDQEAQLQRAALPRHDRGRRHARHPDSAVDQHGRLRRDDRHLDPEALSRGLHSGLRAVAPVHGDRADRLSVAARMGRHAGRDKLGRAHPHPARPAAAARHPRGRDRLDLHRLGDRHRGGRARHPRGVRLRGLRAQPVAGR